MGRNYTFDGARGLAALAVIEYHIGHVAGVPLFRSGYLAVDFFFMLSGFVIEKAYSKRLANGLSLWKFTETRLVRLYPLFAVGVLFGILRAIGAKYGHDPRAPSGAGLVTQIVLNGLLLPAASGTGSLFPLNTPAWSLSLEVAINIIFAASLYRARTGVVAMVCALGAAGMVAGAIQFGTIDKGWGAAGYWVGIARVGFGFTAGILLARHASAIPFRWAAALPVALVALLLIEPHGLRTVFDVVVAIVAFPIMIAAMIDVPVAGLSRRVFAFFGDLSYPLYAIHYPLLVPLMIVARAAHLGSFGATLAITAVCLLAAAMAGKMDAIVRARLSRALSLRRSAKAQSGLIAYEQAPSSLLNVQDPR